MMKDFDFPITLSQAFLTGSRGLNHMIEMLIKYYIVKKEPKLLLQKWDQALVWKRIHL